jgi:hypothetical protein
MKSLVDRSEEAAMSVPAKARSALPATSSAIQNTLQSPGSAGSGLHLVQLKASLRGHDFATQVQMLAPDRGTPARPAAVQQVAARGMAGSGGKMPHLDRIQRSFGAYDISNVQAHTDSHALDAAAAMGANAYASGNHVALGAGGRDLHTVAHEATHVVQQRHGVALSGGVGQACDPYERHADAVADLVVQGKSAEDLLGRMAGGSTRQHDAGQSRALQFERSSDATAIGPTDRVGRLTSNVETPHEPLAHHPAHGETRTGAAFNLGTSGMSPFSIMERTADTLKALVCARVQVFGIAIENFVDRHLLYTEDIDSHVLWAGISALASTVADEVLGKFPVVKSAIDLAGVLLDASAEVRTARGKARLLAFVTQLRALTGDRFASTVGVENRLCDSFRIRFEALGKSSPAPYRKGDMWVEGAQGQYLHTLWNLEQDAQASAPMMPTAQYERKLHEAWIASQTSHARGGGQDRFRQVLSNGYIRMAFDGDVIRKPGDETPDDLANVRCIGATLVASGAGPTLEALKEIVVPWNVWAIDVPKRIVVYERVGGGITPLVDAELSAAGSLVGLVDRHGLHARHGAKWMQVGIAANDMEAREG